VQLFTTTDPADLINSTTTTATSDSVFTDAGSVLHPETLSIDDTLGTWFGSNSQNNASWLELDLGSTAPYYENMFNVTMFVAHTADSCIGQGLLFCVLAIGQRCLRSRVPGLVPLYAMALPSHLHCCILAGPR
jgi:hypothetical protein